MILNLYVNYAFQVAWLWYVAKRIHLFDPTRPGRSLVDTLRECLTTYSGTLDLPCPRTSLTSLLRNNALLGHNSIFSCYVG